MSDFLESIIKRDPAAKSKLIVLIAYPGVKAVFFHLILQQLVLKDQNKTFQLKEFFSKY